MFNVLLEFHPMAGPDFHFDLIPAPIPPPTPFEPHMTGALMNWVLLPSLANTVIALGARVMQRGTDIQSFIPHIPMGPGVLLSPVETIFSGSKSYFGPASVQACGSPIAVAVMVIVNLNLNCGTIPTPSGVVMASNSVVAGMTFGDFLGGLFAMVNDCALQTLMGIALGPLGPIGGNIASLFIGSPLGFSFNGNGHGNVGMLGRLMGDETDFVRGFGEALGGDTAQGQADQQAAVDKMADENKNYDPNHPYRGWNVNGPDGDASKFNNPLVPPQYNNGAMTNSRAEQH